MSSDPPNKAPAKLSAKEERLAAALKRNLARRKAARSQSKD